MNDRDILASCPDYLSIGSMLKATPFTEGDKRYVYIEASDETVDAQGEIVLQKALSESSKYFEKYGNLDIDHITMIGARAGIPNYSMFEIGVPISVSFNGDKTLVKGEIASGTGQAADKANQFWASMTERTPPAKWYPSVGGAVIERDVITEPGTNLRKAIIKKVRWSNIGFSRTPVNQNVPTVSTTPFDETLAKSWGGATVIDLSKALEASSSTNVAALTGGGALGAQSLDEGIHTYTDFRESLAAALRAGLVGSDPGLKEMARYSVKKFSLPLEKAAEWVERFARDLISTRSKS